MQKKILTINDISCVGRCSLTVELPLISCTGVECSVLPTAILSTHTGGFTNYTFTDFTNEMMPIVNHWKSLNKQFDGISSGFLGSIDQIDIVKNIIKKFKTDKTIAIVDPAMADNGILYPTFDMKFATHMASLCQMGDVILPNITEACILTGVEYQEDNHSDEYINKVLNALKEKGMKKVILTGVRKAKDKIGAIAYDPTTNSEYYYDRELIPGYFHGTGDVFASVFTGCYILGKSLEESMEIAVDITVSSIKHTIKYEGIDLKYGVCFEEAIPELIERLKQNK